jgi:hypothetical protein
MRPRKNLDKNQSNHKIAFDSITSKDITLKFRIYVEKDCALLFNLFL